jgi:putative zinc finger/helix-turn-helix YgiT family protein
MCGKGELVERNGSFDVRYVDRRGVDGVLTMPSLRRLVCNSCGEEILDDEASGQVEEARRTAMGLLTPEEIRDLRYRFGKTQVQMSALLGVGEKTYCRWESGSFIQSVAFDNYLRLIRDVPEASARLVSLEHCECPEPAMEADGGGVEFTFLRNFGGVAEAAAKFTLLMTAGMLHVPARPHAER